MKIAFVVHDFLLGTGHGRYCIELAGRFSRDHEIHVLANTFASSLDFPFTRHFVRAWRATALSSVLTFPSAAEKILAREPFDVVHAQGYSCRRADVITAHVCNAARYTRAPAQGLRDRLFPFLVIPRERALYQKSTGAKIIAVSKVIQGELEKEYRIASTVIHHGIDTKTFAPGKTAPPDCWLFVGEAVKGLSQAITALAQFPKARLDVVSRSRMDGYKFLADRLGVFSRVTFHGPTIDLLPFYQNAGLFLYPSAYDSFGMVVAEAMACGLPVIVGKDVGAAEWISCGINGLLCDPQNLNSITAQIDRLEKSSEAELEKMRQAARRTALANSWEQCAAKTLSVYERAISIKCAKK